MFERLENIPKYILSICTLCVCLTACGSGKAADTKYKETENIETPISGERYVQSQVETVPAAEDNQVETVRDSDETPIALEFTGMLEEIPELDSGGNYICYKDMLVFDSDNTVYRWQNGKYQRTDESLADMLGIKDQKYFTYRQSKNLIVAESEDEKSFLVYDMDTDSRYAYPCNHNMRIWYPWHVYDGEIYYMEYEYDEENRVSHVEGAIRKINLADGKDTEVYRSENIWYFFMRGDGTIFYEGHGDGHDYWKLEQDANGEYRETKLWETDRWKFREWSAFNQYGLIVVGQFPYIDDVSGELFEQVVIKDDGEVETLYLPGDGKKYLDNGYLTYDYDSADRVTGVTCYDYEGNILATYPLIDKSKLDEGFSLARHLYHDRKITAIYEQEDTGELYIVQVEADFDQIGEMTTVKDEPDFDALNVYQSALRDNERAWEDPSYPMEDNRISGALGVLKGNPEYTLCYSFADIAGDGTEDLVIGARLENEYILCGVYAYDRYEDAVYGCYFNYEVDPITLYENGIIEHVHQMDGKTYYYYDKLIKNTSNRVGMDKYKYVFDIGPDEENGEIGYFKKNYLSGWEAITEEEFWSAINQYESLPIELNWHELDGFWEPEG